MSAQFAIGNTSVNFRAAPKLRPDNVLAVLPPGHLVSRHPEKDSGGWACIETVPPGAQTVQEGFVSRELLVAVEESSLPEARALTEVHLPLKQGVTRSGEQRAYRLSEPEMPERTAKDAAERCQQLQAIVDFLSVETSHRYATGEGKTFCNIYAYDYACLSKVYLPRVWWTTSALVKLAQGQSVPVSYGNTVAELNANALFGWLMEPGLQFGWQRIFSLDALQSHANQGGVGVVVGIRKDLNRSGHITAVIPEKNGFSAIREAGVVTVPLQSQADLVNRARFTGKSWWLDSKFAQHGFWIHP